jgi:hypothetical protein
MSYQEVSVIEVRGCCGGGWPGRGLREVPRVSGTDRKTVRRLYGPDPHVWAGP